MPLYRMLQKKIFILHGVKRLPVLACDRDQKKFAYRVAYGRTFFTLR